MPRCYVKTDDLQLTVPSLVTRCEGYLLGAQACMWNINPTATNMLLFSQRGLRQTREHAKAPDRIPFQREVLLLADIVADASAHQTECSNSMLTCPQATLTFDLYYQVS